MTKPSIDEQLEEILNNMWRDSGMAGDLNIADDDDKIQQAIQAIQAIKALFIELVGQNQELDIITEDDPGFDWENHWKNELRAELRKAIESLRTTTHLTN